MTTPVRSLIGQLSYGLDLDTAPDAADAERVATALVSGRGYRETVQTYSDAVDTAARSSEPLAWPGQDETHLRAYLRLLRAALDARQPWPAPRFTVIPAVERPEVIAAPPLLHLADTAIEDLHPRLGTVARRVAPDLDAIVLAIVDGPVVAFTGAPAPGPLGVDVRARDISAGALRAALVRSTGIDAEQVPSPRVRDEADHAD